MPRPPWRRRRTTDLPRPAGRRWAGRLYRGRVLARQVLRVPHRRRAPAPLLTGELPGETRRHTSRAVRTVGYRPALPRPVRLGRVPAVATGVEPATAEVGGGEPGETPPAPAGLLPGDPTLLRRLCFLLVSGATLASLSLGLLVIMLAMRGEVRVAALALVGCVLLDGLDGSLARRLKVSSPFGAQMDSLADMCAFGVAAPVLIYAWVAGTVPAAAAVVACALVAGCAAIRLARFNVCGKDHRFFTGLPTTLAAAVLALLVLVDLPVRPSLLLVGVAALAFAMVSSFPYATLARLLRLPPWLWLVPLAGALVDPRLTLLAVVAVYLASGPVLWLRQRRTV